jgi:hypothetical protein
MRVSIKQPLLHGLARLQLQHPLQLARRAGRYALRKLQGDKPKVRFGSLRRLKPVSRSFGLARGWPIDRYYIESFLNRYRQDVRGRVLEAGGLVNYTREFGDTRVTQADVMYPEEGHADATLVADLATGRNIANEAFDCMILTQVFQFIYDTRAAAAHAYRGLKPGGVLLATFPGISQIARNDDKRWGDYWRFTERSVKHLFSDAFGERNVSVETHGNVLAATAFLQGLAAQELTREELEYRDPEYPLAITVRAIKLPWNR